MSGALLSLHGAAGWPAGSGCFCSKACRRSSRLRRAGVLAEVPEDARWLTGPSARRSTALPRERSHDGATMRSTLGGAVATRGRGCSRSCIPPIPGGAVRHRVLSCRRSEDGVGRKRFDASACSARFRTPPARSRWCCRAGTRIATGERRWHVLGSALVGAAGLRVRGVQRPRLVDACRCRSRCWAWRRCSAHSGRWRRRRWRGVGAAAAIALINSVGNTGGFVGPYLLGSDQRRDAQFHGRAVRHRGADADGRGAAPCCPAGCVMARAALPPRSGRVRNAGRSSSRRTCRIRAAGSRSVRCLRRAIRTSSGCFSSSARWSGPADDRQ